MDAIIRFLQDTGFYLFSQDGNWRCLIMLGIACVLLYLGIVKKFEPLLLVPIAFGMLIKCFEHYVTQECKNRHRRA